MPNPDPTFRKINVLLGLDPDHHKKVKKYRTLEMESVKIFLYLVPFAFILIVLVDYFVFGFVSNDRTRVAFELILTMCVAFVVIIYWMSNKMIYVESNGTNSEHWVFYEPLDKKKFEKDIGVDHEKYQGL